MTETIYLPNNVDGRQVLLTMKQAFDSDKLFKVVDGKATWNGVEVKRNISGGVMG